jgi:thiol-disulfide isomerase/thioredoxin
MDMFKNRPLVGVLILGFVGAVIYLATSSNSDEQAPNSIGSASQSPTAQENVATGSASDGTSGNYISYETYQGSGETYSDTNVVLFFNASWCSTCKVARENFEADLDQIPSNLTIVLVDFDESADLKKQYGVTVQHTFVQINDQGEELKKWSGSVSVNEVTDQVI